MYASFSITPHGFEPATQRPSCLPCRRKKKKCDGTKPKCGLCRDSYRRDECVWPAERRPRKPRRPNGVCDAVSHSDDLPQDVLPDVKHEAHIPKTARFELPRELLDALPELSQETIMEAATIFESKVFCNHPAYKGSVSGSLLPLAVQHKPLLHAWISCILIIVSHDAPQWKEESVRHYDHAVRGFKTSIMDDGPTHEWKRATALLCHAIELLQPAPSSQLARSHLSGAHQMFQLARGDPNLQNLPSSEHDVLLFEAYILRTSTNCLLQQDIHKDLPLTYLHDLMTMHQRSLNRMSMEMRPQDCPWLAVPGYTLIDLVYRASWLNAHHPWSESLQPEAISIWRQLAAGEEAPGWFGEEGGDFPAVRSVTRWACQALLRPLLLDSETHAASAEHDDLVAKGAQALDVLTQGSGEDSWALWSLIVLGAFSAGGQDRETCVAVLERYRVTMPEQTIDSILAFWNQAWETEVEAHRFRDSELLRSILL